MSFEGSSWSFDFSDLVRLGDRLLADVVRLTGAAKAYFCEYQTGQPLPDNLAEDLRSEVGRAVFLKQMAVNSSVGRMVIPTFWGENGLGAMIIEDVSQSGLSDVVRPYLTSFVELAVENLAFRKRLKTDPLTGLYNYGHLVGRLKDVITNRWSGTVHGAGRRLSLGGQGTVEPFSLLLMEVPAAEDERVVIEEADKLREAVDPAGTLARVIGGRFGYVASGMDRDAASALASELALAVPGLAAGYLSFPADCPDLLSGDPQAPGEAAQRIIYRAGRALEAGARHGGAFAFADVLKGDGRVIEVQPGGRVVIDLGGEAGVFPGMRFKVVAERRDEDAEPVGRYPHDHKAELVVLRVDPDASQGEVVFLADPLWPLDKGDELALLTGDAALVEDLPEETDPVTSLLTLRPFTRRLAEVIDTGRAGGVLLFKLDGFSRTEQVSGKIAAQARLRVLADMVREAAPDGSLFGRYSPDTVAMYGPGLDQARALELGGKVSELMAGTNSLSIGLAVYPFFEFMDMLPDAVKALDHASLLGPGSIVAFDAVSLNVSGDRLYAAGRIEEAAGEFERALVIDPTEVNVLNSLGVCYGQLGRMEEAASAFSRSIEADPQNFMGHFNLGFALARSGRSDDAIAAFERAVETDPDHPDVRIELGRLLLSAGRIEDALEHLELAASAPRPRSHSFRYLGQAHWMAGNLDEAAHAYRRAVKQNPMDPEALSGLGALFLERGTDPDVALSLCRQAVDLDPQSPRHALRLGWALTINRRPDEAAEILSGLVKAGEGGAEAGWRLAVALEAMGDLVGAREALRASLGMDEAFEPSLALISDIELRLAELEAGGGGD